MIRAKSTPLPVDKESIDKFFSKVLKTETCWLWLGGKTKGYGQFYYRGSVYRAHRFYLEVTRGRIDPELVVDHLCEVRACVNPEHLRVTTNAVNVLRGSGPPAINANKTHCNKGHPFNEANTRIRKSVEGDWRVCRICHKDQCAKERARGTRR